jgi:transposase
MTKQEEILKIQTAMKEAKDRRSYERFQSVYLSLKGYTQREIADITGRCVKTIHHYVSAYKEKGLDGLEITYSPGAPTKLTKEQQQQLVETVAYKQPVDVGFPAKYNWTLSLVTQYIKREWGPSYTLRGASKMLHSLGLSYTRPTYTLKKADKEKQDEFVLETFPALKKSF